MNFGVPAARGSAIALLASIALLAACASNSPYEPAADAAADGTGVGDIGSVPDADAESEGETDTIDAEGPPDAADGDATADTNHATDAPADMPLDAATDSMAELDADTAADQDANDVIDAPDACRCAAPETCAEPGCIDVRARPCRSAADCAEWTCSSRGVCVSPLPLVHGFVRNDDAGFPWPAAWSTNNSEAFSPWYAFVPGSDPLATIFGAASPIPPAACLARMADGAWTQDDAFCATPTVRVVTTAAYRTSEGTLRVLLGGARSLRLYDETGALLLRLHELFAEDDRRRECDFGFVGLSDLDLDGRLDIYAECVAPADVGGRANAGIVWLGTDDDSFEVLDDATPYRPISSWGHRLADAHHDFDGDGLLDRILINDSYSNLTARNTLLEPGWRVRTCSPIESCFVDAERIVDDSSAWGSFMGAELIHLADGRERLYLTDQGPNRLLDPVDPTADDEASAAGIENCPVPGPDGDTLYFSWSAITEDFNHDGLDDLLVTRGDAVAPSALNRDAPPHPAILFVQQPDSTFSCQTDPAWEAADGLDLSRGALSVDLDYDGLLDVFIARWQRPPLLLEEADHGQPLRCSVRMLPTVVPAAGYGLASAPFPEGPWTVERMSGQTAIQPPNEFVSTLRAGYARFPSGAVMPFDCGDGAGPVVLEEPDWIDVETVGDALHVVLDESLWPEPVTAVAFAPDVDRPAPLLAMSPDGDGRWTATVGALPPRVMVRINERWVGVWLPTAP